MYDHTQREIDHHKTMLAMALEQAELKGRTCERAKIMGLLTMMNPVIADALYYLLEETEG